MIRRILLFSPLVVFIFIAVFLMRGLELDPKELPSALLNKPFPKFELTSLYKTDQKLTSKSLQGKPALVNVWATWCPSCKEEHEQLNKIKAKGYLVQGINYKDDPLEAKIWLQRYDDPYTINIFDPAGQLGLELGVYGAPETFIIDHNAMIRYRHVGVINEAVWQQLKPILDQLIAEAR